MKKITILFVFAICTIQGNAQKLATSEIPEAVISAFKAANPNITNAEWNKEKSGYKVRYIANKRPCTVCYTNSGTRVVHDSKVAIATLPPGVKTYLDKNFPGNAEKINKVLKMTKPDGTVNYDVEMSGTDYIFDAKGSYLKSVKK